MESADEFLKRVVDKIKEFRFEREAEKAAGEFDLKFLRIETPDPNAFRATATVEARAKGDNHPKITKVTLEAKLSNAMFYLSINGEEPGTPFPCGDAGLEFPVGYSRQEREAQPLPATEDFDPFCEKFYLHLMDSHKIG